jgi:hypothetical protein
MAYRPTGKPRGRPPGQPAFARVVKAREKLAQQADEAIDILKTAAKVAAAKGQHGPVAWMLEHMSAVDTDGKEVRPIASGIDRQAVESGPKGLTVNVGWIARDTPALAPIEVKTLPGETIE